MKTQAEKAQAFRALHDRGEPFLIPNPWDVGTARLLEQTGFEALATTSAGFAYSTGRRDHGVPRDEMIEHSAQLVAAVDLPVSADLENGFGDSAEAVAETLRMAVAAGLVGCSIEDSTNDAENPIYEIGHATDRVRAAAEIARGLSFPFMFTARAENYLHGRKDLADTIARLQAFQGAGADVLYAPGMTDTEEIATVIRSVDRPVNVLAGMQGTKFDMETFGRIGVRRVSVGGALTRVALSAFLGAAREMKERGTFSFVNGPVSTSEISEFMGRYAR